MLSFRKEPDQIDRTGTGLHSCIAENWRLSKVADTASLNSKEFMASSPISNSLLGIDNTAGNLPVPFERPNEKVDFWVLELSHPKTDDLARWCSRTSKVLTDQTHLLSKLCSMGSRLTLFIEVSAADPVPRLEAAFLKILTDRSIALELYTRPPTAAGVGHFKQ
jgi:hypothetical protein